MANRKPTYDAEDALRSLMLVPEPVPSYLPVYVHIPCS